MIPKAEEERLSLFKKVSQVVIIEDRKLMEELGKK